MEHGGDLADKTGGTGVPVFRGHAFSVRVQRLRTARGLWVEREIVDRVDAVAVVADVSGQLLLVRQYRPAVGRELWELPAGRIDAGEDAQQAARRELQEETGYRAATLQRLARLYPSPGYTSEAVTFYFADGPTAGPPAPEPGEDLTVALFDQARLRALLRSEEPVNGLLWVGAQWWLARANAEA